MNSIIRMSAASAALAIGAWSFAAPASPSPPAAEEAAPELGDEGTDRAMARRLLERRMQRAQAEAERTRAALEKLDEGAPLEEVREAFDAPAPFSRPDESIDADAAMEVLADVSPGLHTGLSRAREENPERFRAAMARTGPRLAELMRLREEDPKAYELRVEQLRLNREIKLTAFRITAAERRDAVRMVDRLRSRLEELLSQQFDLAIREKSHQMGRITRRLNEAQNEIQNLTSRRGEVIRQRLDEVLEQARARAERRGGRPPFLDRFGPDNGEPAGDDPPP